MLLILSSTKTKALHVLASGKCFQIPGTETKAGVLIIYHRRFEYRICAYRDCRARWIANGIQMKFKLVQ